MQAEDKMISSDDATKALAPRGKDTAADKAGEELDFAATMKRLEGIVKSLEGGTLSLEDSLKGFEEGIRLARNLESILDRAEKKVQEILNPPDGDTDDGDIDDGDTEKDSHLGDPGSEEC